MNILHGNCLKKWLFLDKATRNLSHRLCNSHRWLTLFNTMLIFLFVSLSTYANNASITTVQGQNNINDISNVQQAVDNYKTVVLEGIFNFSDCNLEPYCIKVNNNTMIVGSKSNIATIEGGQYPIFSDNANVSLSVSNLHFNHSIGSAIRVLRGNHIKIEHNVVTNLKELEYTSETGGTLFDASAFVLGWFRAAPFDTIDLFSVHKFKTISVLNNEIDLGLRDDNGNLIPRIPAAATDPYASRAITIYKSNFNNANLANNKIENSTRIAIDTVNNHGKLLIKSNEIDLSPIEAGSGAQSDGDSYGIHILQDFFGLLPNAVANEGISAEVFSNTINHNLVSSDGASSSMLIGGKHKKLNIFNNTFNLNGSSSIVGVACVGASVFPQWVPDPLGSANYPIASINVFNNIFMGEISARLQTPPEPQVNAAILFLSCNDSKITQNDFTQLEYAAGPGSNYVTILLSSLFTDPGAFFPILPSHPPSMNNKIMGGEGIICEDNPGDNQVISGDYDLKWTQRGGAIGFVSGCD